MNKSWLIPTLLFPVTLTIVPAAAAQTLPDGPLTVASSASGDAVGCRDFFAIKSAEIVDGRLQLRAENHGFPVAWDLAVKGGGFSAWKRLQMIATLMPLPQDASAQIKGKFTGFGLEGRVLGILSGRGYSECLVKFTLARAGSVQAEAINTGETPLVPKSDIANRPGAVKTGAPAREQVLEQIREQVREKAREKASQVAAVEPTATPAPAGKIKSDRMAIEKPTGADIPDGEVSPFRIGQIYEAFAQIFDGSDHMQIPLPACAWHVVGVKETRSSSGVSTLATVYLVQTVDKRLVSVVIIGYPVINRSLGWRVPPWCERGRKHHFEGKAMYAGTQVDCWGVAHAEMTKADEKTRQVRWSGTRNRWGSKFRPTPSPPDTTGQITVGNFGLATMLIRRWRALVPRSTPITAAATTTLTGSATIPGRRRSSSTLRSGQRRGRRQLTWDLRAN